MFFQQVQADIIPILKHISSDFRGPLDQTVQFHTELPELTMDFVPQILRSVLLDVFQGNTTEAYAPEVISLLAEQQYPSSLSLVITIPGMDYLEIDGYRQLLSAVEGEVYMSITQMDHLQLQIELPIYNRSSYWGHEQVLKLLANAEN
ncbi:MAG: hypothetical protein OER04_04955 [Cyclobacteriaceae bacterium]|nr:hypothetical protein [Cyclobacteriaceae bacterium]